MHTQAELVRALRAAGLRVSQATVSRDIKRLGLVKVPTQDGRARYLPPAEALRMAPDAERRLTRAFQEYAVGVDEGSGLILVKTTTGTANAVAEAIDEVRWPEVAGTVAGDNTILVVPRTPRARLALRRRLQNLLP
ncbi:MAG: arginine repressor [Armatimonadota bacterium]|nr:arginine repressor [Armatimonadota bacterium]